MDDLYVADMMDRTSASLRTSISRWWKQVEFSSVERIPLKAAAVGTSTDS